MRSILQKKGLRFVFAANVVSMIGSGMNAAAVAWYILQATHSEIALGTFAVVQTLPAILLLPFTGVIAGIRWQSQNLGTLRHEHAGGRRLLDVLADHNSAHSGADARR
jgi:hypothetical protein